MNLHELSPAAGSNTKAYRKGRGNGSGNGKTAGRGQKGQWVTNCLKYFTLSISSSHNSFPVSKSTLSR